MPCGTVENFSAAAGEHVAVPLLPGAVEQGAGGFLCPWRKAHLQESLGQEVHEWR